MENVTIPLVFVILTLPIAILPSIWLAKKRYDSKRQWVIHLLLTGSVVLFIFLTLPWAFTSYYLRFVVLALFVFAAVRSYKSISSLGASAGVFSRTKILIYAVLLIGFNLLNALVILAHFTSKDSMNLSFPLENGIFYVLQGGSSRITNPFHAYSPQERFAIDLVKLNRFGNRAKGLVPQQLEMYESFGEIVQSPCNGRVVAARDGLPDNRPGRPDVNHSEGNHVILSCNGAQVFLAHMMNGSVKATIGDPVKEDQPIGKIGNSGNTIEPHLHISVMKNGEAMPMRFDGSFLSLNRIIHED